jgi:hypothetical protein
MNANSLTTLTPKQNDWFGRMQANIALLHTQWYGWDGNERVFGGMDQELFFETDRKIREAAHRLGIRVESPSALAEANEGWDGELNADLVVLDHVLDAILEKKAA